MSTKIHPTVFYGSVTLLTAIVWFLLREFARLPSGVHHKFFSAMFIPYLMAVVLVANWYELQRRKAKEQLHSDKRTNASPEPPK